MPRKRKKKRSSPIADYKGKVRGSGNPLYAISQTRHYIGHDLMQPFADWAAKTFVARGEWKNLKPRSLKDIHCNGYFQMMSVEREIQWVKFLLIAYAKEINAFVKMSGAFEDALLNSDYQKTSSILDEIDNKVCFSLWSVSNNIAIRQLFLSEDGQKDFSTEIKEGKNADKTADIVKFLTHYWSVRAEEDVSPARFFSLAAEFLNTSGAPLGLLSYIDYQLRGNLPDSQEEAELLSVINACSIIDGYELFVDLATKYITENSDHADLYVSAITELVAVIDDNRLRKLAFLRSSDPNMLVDFKQVGDVDANTVLLDGSQRFSLAFPLFDQSQTNTVLNSALRNLSECQGYGPDAFQSCIDLLKAAYVLNKTKVGKWVEVSVWNSMDPDPEEENERELKAFTLSNGHDPFSLLHLPKSQAYYEFLQSKFINKKFFTFIKAMIGEEVLVKGALSPEIESLVSIYRSFEVEDYEQALRLSEEHLCEYGLRSSALIPRLHILASCGLGDVEKAVVTLANMSIEDSEVIRFLPFKHVERLITKPIRKKITKRIEASIFYDVLVKHFNPTQEHYRSYAYDDFLIKNGMERPSEISDADIEINKATLIYYLRNICEPSVMQVSTAFSGTEDVYNERLEVCQHLIEIDPDNTEDYEEELREIIRDRHIKSAVDHLEQSKIYINEEPIRLWAIKHLPEDFNRYKKLVASGITVVDEDFIREMFDFLSNKNAQGQKLLHFPENEASELLSQIVTRFLSEAFLNQEHGLDCYLSMRIRHGTLSGQLRSALEEENLLTQKDGETGDYKANEFWLRTFMPRTRSRETHEKIDNLLRKFSKEFDQHIDYVAKELIQIRRDEKPNGLFMASLSPALLKTFAADIKHDTSFEEFMSGCFELFWTAVQLDLDRVKKYISGSISNDLMDLLRKLESEVSELSSATFVSDFIDAIRRSQTNLQLALSRMESWFVRPKPTSSVTFSIKELVDVGVETVKTIHKEFHPVMRINAEGIPELTNALQLFSDIFFIIFENIQRHSGNSSNPLVIIDASIVENYLRVRVENQCSSLQENQQTKQKLDSIRSKIEKGEYKKSIPKEGGTGLLKLRKLVGDGSGKSKLDFGFDAEMFFVEFSIEAHNIHTGGSKV